MDKASSKNLEQIVSVELGQVRLKGELVVPADAKGIVLFGHSTGSSRYSTHNYYLADILRQEGKLATLLIDLLTKEEEAMEQRTKHFYHNIGFLSDRLVAVTDWLLENPITHHLKIGYFGADSGGGAALLAAVARPMSVGAVVSGSGHTDLASEALSSLQAPTLLIVGENDLPIISMNEDALAQISTQNKKMEIISKATHLLGEPGAMEEVARLASQWFNHYLTSFEPRELQLHVMSLNH